MNDKAEALSAVRILRRALIIPEKSIRVLYVGGKHCGLPGLPGSMQTSQKMKLDFHTRGTECACAQ